MARWSVHYFKGSKAHYLGVVSASSEKEATQAAAEQFRVDPPRLFRLMVSKLNERERA